MRSGRWRDSVLHCQLILLCILFQFSALSQQEIDTAWIKTPGTDTAVLFTVRNIDIKGNNKTKTSVILREINLHPGDQYPLSELVKKFEFARKQLMNLSLFHEVIVSLQKFEGYDADILIQVKERWYLFPFPYFKPVDRNLNQWLIENNGDLDRVNYGVKLFYNNATGRNDKLRLWLITGYTRQFMLVYQRPYFDEKMRWGFRVGASSGKNREVNYSTLENKQVFYKDEDYIRNFSRFFIEFSHCPALWTTNVMGIAINKEKIADTVAALNPAYLKGGRTHTVYPEFYYILNYTHLNYIPYPTSGIRARLALTKRGFNSLDNYWGIEGAASFFWPVGKKSYVNLEGFGIAKTPGNQIYQNRRVLGYDENYLQGYEYYVMDGMAGGFLKAAFARRLFSFDINVPETKKLAPKRIPFAIYGKIYGNTGYAYDRHAIQQRLNNRMLYSGGIGIDITSIYDITVKLEWSFNQIGENGLFLHKRTPF